ncbi:MAG: restriction endonuclease subunit S [Chitinophagaceae bacterium]|nr:restriction endonuclease subunit S [Chitinophagaceae bacterium]
MALEASVMAQGAKPLRSFVLKMASGATPSVVEFDKYYAQDAESGGVPFIRVQNLSETGELKLDDVKYINEATHLGMLKRSQIEENDLVIKITGVGRMAISSVPPIGFRGNINQHSVVAKTSSRQISELVAAYLNSDIGEKLASRRATGGTRPALDYPALRSIPIVFDERIFEMAKTAREERLSKEEKAAKLLAGIDDYLLNELGISLHPEPTNTIENRTFKTSFTKVSGNRFDPFFNKIYFNDIKECVAKGKYGAVFLKQTITGLLVKGYLPKQEEKEGDNKVVQINSINMDGTIDLDNLLTAKDVFYDDQELKQDDILVVITGATIGKVGYWSYPGKYYLGGDIVKFQTEKRRFDPYFVYAFLRCKPSQIEIKRNVTGATNGHLSPDDVKYLLIPAPPLSVQQMIAKEVRVRTEEAHQLLVQAKMDFEAAKKEIGKLILNTAS